MELAVESPEILDIPAIQTLQKPGAESDGELAEEIATVSETNETDITEIAKPETQPAPASTSGTKVSALSLASIRAKRELQESNKAIVKETIHLPTESFTETDMLLQWNRYAQKLGDKGFRIMESLLVNNDPVLSGTLITLELGSEGSKIDFESERPGLLAHLRSHLHNHNIDIEVVINEAIIERKSTDPQAMFNRLYEINPAIETLKNTFGLEL